LKPKHPASSCQ